MCCVVSRIFYAIMAALMAFDDTIPDRRNGSVKIKFQNPVFYRGRCIIGNGYFASKTASPIAVQTIFYGIIVSGDASQFP